MKKLAMAIMLVGCICWLSTAFAVELFKTGEKVVTTPRFAELAKKGEFGEEAKTKPVVTGRVLEEDQNGTVTIYDPKTKRNTQIHRQFLMLSR